MTEECIFDKIARKGIQMDHASCLQKQQKIQEIFDLAIKMGIESDFRGKEGVEKVLARKKKKYDFK